MKAIVYTSETGNTKAYADLLGEQLSLPVYDLREARKVLRRGEPILYLGWLFAGHLKGYRKAASRYCIKCVCGVGLGDSGSQIDGVRRAEKMSADLPLFTLQGGMDHEKLRGVNRFMIRMLTKMMSQKQDCTEDEERMLELLIKGGNYVSLENLSEVLAWARTTFAE